MSVPIERLLTIKDVMAQLQVSEHTVRRLIESKKLRAVKVGRQWRIHRHILDQFVQKEILNGTPAAGVISERTEQPDV